MKSEHTQLTRALSLAIVALAAIGYAVSASAQAREEVSVHTSAFAADDVDALIAAENARMSTVRADYLRYFQAAYLRYPQIPAGVLESLAFAKTRWNHVVPEAGQLRGAETGHMAPAYGVMALFDGAIGFENQVAQAADLLGVSADSVKADPYTNILAAAALLARDIEQLAIKQPSPEQISGVLAHALGALPSKQSPQVFKHVQDSFAYSVLQALDQGSDDHGVLIQARPIAFEQAFSLETLAIQKASFVRLDVTQDRVETGGYLIDPISETLISQAPVAKSTDYGPALYTQSPNERARAANPTHVTVHQMEGFYAGSISTFLIQGGVSAHYLIRNSDGQVTQMVRESRAGSHVFGNNAYTIGFEQEGFRGQSNWYSDANYREMIAITKSICARWAIPCSSVYTGAASDSENIQATSLRIKGHQHFPDQAGQRTDPGRFFSWSRYASGIGGSVVPSGTLDNFEASEGRFDSEPTASGSTVGISTSSTAQRNNVRVRAGSGSWSEQIELIDSTATSADWDVRLLSGGGNPSQNKSLQKAGGRLGFWAYTAAPGITVQMAVDDSDGTERSIAKNLPTNAWTFFEWKLDDQAEWDAWAGASNGTITAANVTLDSIWFKRAQNANPIYIYIDDVSFRIQ